MSSFVINPYAFGGDNITAFDFLQTTDDNANATTYTITGVNFGTADANRRIVIGVASRSLNASHDISSATIGGVSATILAQVSEPLSGAYNCHSYITADVPTGSSGTVVLTMSNGGLRLQIATYRVISAASLVLASDDSDVVAGTNSANLSIGAQNGIVLAAATHVFNGIALQFSGISTTDSNSTVESVINVAFASERTTAPATQNISTSLISPNGNTGTLAFGVCLK